MPRGKKHLTDQQKETINHWVRIEGMTMRDAAARAAKEWNDPTITPVSVNNVLYYRSSRDRRMGIKKATRSVRSLREFQSKGKRVTLWWLNKLESDNAEEC